jgi:hypothetical protein
MKRVINCDDLADIVCEVVSYLEDTDESSLEGYFNEITNTGLFHDAIGKVIERRGLSVTVETEY